MGIAADPRIIHIGETTSTNAEAWRLVRAGETLPLWVRADRQTSGRGRQGRTWDGEPGNLFLTGAYATAAPATAVGQIALVAAVALYDTVAAMMPDAARADLRLKWPNDLLAQNAKLAGILVEGSARPSHDDHAVIVGIGLNIRARPAALVRNTACLADFGVTLAPADLAEALALRFDAWFRLWADGTAFERDILPAWLSRAGPRGEPISVKSGDGAITGRYAGLDPNGFLLLITADGRCTTITHGDVSLISHGDSEGLE